MNGESPYLSVAEAAQYLRLKRRTLDNLRWAGGGPKYRKHGGRVLYRRDELEAWSEAREYRSTSARS
jgi:excisionase family DNA binding protein